MFNALDTSTSALVAQRIRLDTIAGNLANAPVPGYRRRVPLFAEGFSAVQLGRAGVHVSEIREDPAPGRLEWDPTHPLAQKSGPHQGYVEMSNVSIMHEMVNAIEAHRAYEANITMVNVTKAISESALRLLG